jgi:hypothetical protein
MIKFDIRSDVALRNKDRIAGSVELILHDCSFEEYNVLISELREMLLKNRSPQEHPERDRGMVVK